MKKEYKMDISENYNDCGVILYDTKNQKEVQAGGSGPVCSALVVYGDIIPKMHTYSRKGGKFWSACEKQANGWGMDMFIPSGYASYYYQTHEDNPNLSLGEHFAETVSVVSFKNKESKNNATLLYDYHQGETDVVDYDDFNRSYGVLFDETATLLGI